MATAMAIASPRPSPSPLPKSPSQDLTIPDEHQRAVANQMRLELGATADDHDDHELLRFAIARAMNAKQASKMFANYLDWRKRERIDDLPVPSVNGAPLLQTVRGYKTVTDGNAHPDQYDRSKTHPGMPEAFPKWFPYTGGGSFHKLDYEGQPVFIERIGLYDVKGMIKYCTAESIVDYHIRNAEFLTRVLMRECSETTGRVIDKHTVIFDFDGTGFHQFDTKALMLLKAVAESEQDYYPERLSRLFIINAPFLFTRVWSVVKPWLNQVTLDKIHIMGSNYNETLLKHIPPENLPRYLGGTCECSHMQGGCVPSPRLDHKHQNYGREALLENCTQEHTYQVSVPEGQNSSGAVLVYGFRSSGQGCRFEVRHKRDGCMTETSILPCTLHDSDKKIVTGQLPTIQGGTYVFAWKKPPGSWISSGPSVKLEYSVEILDESESKGLKDANPSTSTSHEAMDAAAGSVTITETGSSSRAVAGTSTGGI
ncbi:hypothetical protein SeMB42_g03254 [Synchytrium endobioticum]|uniref:CRAL-TRIO domain-containing protein n=1 Tax=Synchytrium endobioticum TaxID=286115 RepID=A0A507D802_9FUNG|nr:hypothetical protein SeLEV6574_g05288 [Synchytrium endobioticum]TPX47604.1 hypothetical protein SeMB42_g03254 [Synchytrium endobioticum]